jgi:hypothetical protein
MATATDSTEPPPPRYFGPCLVAPLVLHAQQPEPAAWVPPREWNPATAGWDPRITYRGLSADAKASLTEEFLLFEVPGHADDDPEDPAVQQGKGHVLLASLPTLFRSMGRTDKRRNALCAAACEAKSVGHPASGAACLHVATFLEVGGREQVQRDEVLARAALMRVFLAHASLSHPNPSGDGRRVAARRRGRRAGRRGRFDPTAL